MRKWAKAVGTGMLLTGALLLGQPGQAAATPPMVLPDADLVCGGEVLATAGWVTRGAPPTLWITDGSLAGHYVVLESAHLLTPGLVATTAVSGDFPGVLRKVWGKKTALRDGALSCTFVSRWDLPGDDDDFTVYGPITIARVS